MIMIAIIVTVITIVVVIIIIIIILMMMMMMINTNKNNEARLPPARGSGPLRRRETPKRLKTSALRRKPLDPKPESLNLEGPKPLCFHSIYTFFGSCAMEIWTLYFALWTASAWPTEPLHYPHYHGRQVPGGSCRIRRDPTRRGPGSSVNY